jgi:CDP-6-deoxy-D-xylo-4-hexulose-3-dehydrase
MLKKAVQSLLKEYESEYILPAKKVPLSSPTFGEEEILEVVKVMASSRVTQGQRVLTFEKDFAKYIGSEHAIMVNSGSSANFLATSAMISKRYSQALKPGDEVIVPALTWPTTIYPFAQLGLTPVLVDADLSTFNISAEAIRKAITPRTKMVCIVPILGNPCDMDEIVKICKEHDLFLFEDTCESLGSSYKNKMCGSFGDVGTFSFFFSHHMTSIEGGMIVTDDGELADILRSQRAHGWIRNMTNASHWKSNRPDLDERFLFVDWGYNFRSTDLNAAIASIQLKKLPGMNLDRQKIARSILEKLKPFDKDIQLPQSTLNADHTWFGFPFLIKPESKRKRSDLVRHLESNGIDTRPITGGDLSQQPAFELFNWKKGGDLSNVAVMHTYGIYFGTHPGMTEEHCIHIGNTFASFFNS